MLAVSGRLDSGMYGPGSLSEDHRRRSIYFTIKRSRLPPFMMLFDAPDPLQGLAQRSTSTVAPQALALMNDQRVRRLAQDFADRVLRRAGDPNVPAGDGILPAQEALPMPPQAQRLSTPTP